MDPTQNITSQQEAQQLPLTKPSQNGAPPSAEPTDTEVHLTPSQLANRTQTLAVLGLAGATAAGLYVTTTPETTVAFITAYILEYALSVDNLLVFLLIFSYFRTPLTSQPRVLNYGVLGAMVMRGVFIVAGEALTKKFKFVTVFFASILLFSAFKLATAGEEEDDDLENNFVIKTCKKFIPVSTHYSLDKFFTRENGAMIASPLLLVLACIEISDLIFALDSVPAVIGISDDALVIYLSNILAVLGLRSLYFLVAEGIEGIKYLQPSLSIVLGFVGAKMIAGVAGIDVSVTASLAVVVGVLGGGVALSYLVPDEKPEVDG